MPPTVSYRITTADPVTSLRGTVSINGSAIGISGTTRIDAPVLNATITSGALSLGIDKPIGTTVILEQAPDLKGPWSIIPAGEASMVVPLATGGNRFYRLRLGND